MSYGGRGCHILTVKTKMYDDAAQVSGTFVTPLVECALIAQGNKTAL